MTKHKIIDPHNAIDEQNYPVISVIWHNRLLFLPLLFPRRARKSTVAVVSASRDGQYLTDFLFWFGIKCIRGSSSKRGRCVMSEGIKALDNGLNLCITPDGPRGPKYVIKKGPVQLASKTQIPVLPFTINISSYWELKSWDNFQIPKPGATITLIMGAPIYIPPNLDDQELEKYRVAVEQALLSLLPENCSD